MTVLSLAALMLASVLSQDAAGSRTAAAARETPATDADRLELTGCLEARDGSYVLTDARPAGAGQSTAASERSGASAGKGGAGASDAPVTHDRDHVTAGTTGTVPRPEGTAAAPIRTYRLTSKAGVDLAAHEGHTVEVRGTLEPTTATPPGEPAPREGRGSATAEPTSRMREAVIAVTTVRRVATGCQR